MGNSLEEMVNNARIILPLAHDRNERLVSYIRLTDGAIWGFLGFAAVNLFKDSNYPSTNIPFFLILLIVSMFIWRETVNRYQDSIIDGYKRIVNCEIILTIDDRISVKKNLRRDQKCKCDQDLLEKLRRGNYKDLNHIKLNWIAFILGSLGIIFLVLWGYCYCCCFHIFEILSIGLVIIFIWFWYWCHLF